MSKSANDYLESLFTGVNILIDKKIEEISYDMTIVCTIMDDSDSKNGAYKVSDGSTIFIAYSDVDSYTNGTQVRVNIPEGDFTQQKYIVGKYVSDNDSNPITYISPTDTVMDISGNLITNLQHDGIIANGNDRELVLWNTKLDKSIISMQDNEIYNTIILKADFKTTLSNYELIQGNYGLRLAFSVQPSINSEVTLRRYVDLDSSEMFGNPYSFSIWSPQAKVVKINTIGIINGVELSLYQKGNFENKEGPIIPLDTTTNNILIKNVAIGLGCDLTDVEDNTVQIYTENDPSYIYGLHTNETNLKTIGLLWLNKDENNKYVGFSDGVYDYDYDELDYLARSKVDSRLLNQKGREGIPQDKISLTLAANIEEASASILKATEVVTKDLTNILTELRKYVSNVSSYTDNINKFIGSTEDENYNLIVLTDKIKDLLNGTQSSLGLTQRYEKILKFGYETWTGDGTENSYTEEWQADWEQDIATEIKNIFIKINNNFEWLLKTDSSGGFSNVKTLYSGVLSVYDTYSLRIKRMVAAMNGYLGWLDKTVEVNGVEYIEGLQWLGFQKDYIFLNKYFPQDVFETDHSILNSYETKQKVSFVLYKSPDLSADDNKYCIYWYRYEKDYVPPASEQIMPDGWRRLTLKDDFYIKKDLDINSYKKNTYYIQEESTGKFVVCDDDSFNANLTYYELNSKCEASDSDLVNIGLSSVYFYDDNNELPYGYRKTKTYKENRIYFQKETTTDSDGNEIVTYLPVTDNSKLKDSEEYYYDEDFKENVKVGKYYARTCINSDGKWIHAPKVLNRKGLIRRYMQNDFVQEKFVAVVFYNHNMYKSNELIFTNSEVVPDKTTLDKGDIITFEHLENSSDDFQLYNTTNYLRDSSDATRSRQIRCHYDGLQAKDNAFINGQIYWYVPRVSTMIDIDEDDLINSRGFVVDDHKSTFSYMDVSAEKEYIKDTFYIKDGNDYKICTASAAPAEYYERDYSIQCFYKKVLAKKKENADAEPYEWDKWDYTNGVENLDNRDFWYQIKPYFESTANNNELKCEFLKNEDVDPVQGVQIFTFGVAGTCGTKYTLAITSAETEVAATTSKGLKLKAQLKDFHNQLLDIATILTPVNFKIEWDCFDSVPGVLNPVTMMLLKYSKQQCDFTTDAGVWGILCASGSVIMKGDSIVGTDDSLTTEGRHRTVDLKVLHKVPWSSGDYYIQGPTDIIYNSLGTLDDQSMFNTPYKIFYKKQIEDGIDENGNPKILHRKDEEVSNVTWSIEYYKRSKSSKRLSKLTSSDDDYEFYSGYMPYLEQDNLIAPPMFLDNLDCFPIVVAKKGLNILWRQPIIMVQNKYGSPMLNDWDGTLDINEENGTILSSMVGAGRKTANNAFEGVLMGDVAVGASTGNGFFDGANIGISNQTGLGLYGFHEGAQSFGFSVSGTAFLGKSGSGRIIFNGDHGTIASSNWFTGDPADYDRNNNSYPNGGQLGTNEDGLNTIVKSSNAGMCIDLDQGWIDAYNFKLTSKNIHLNSNPTYNPDNENGSLRRWGITNPYNNYDEYYLRIGEENKTGFIGLDTDGKLEIRVNSFWLTGNLGNENLFKQTSPRKTVLVPHWNPVTTVTAAKEKIGTDGKPVYDDKGNPVIEVEAKTETVYVEAKRPENGEPVYTYNVSAWNKKLQGLNVPTVWQDANAYAQGTWVKAYTYPTSEQVDQGNIWQAKSLRAAHSTPPGADSHNWQPCIDIIEEDTSGKKYILDIYGNNTEITQTVSLKPDSDYSVSGYFKIPNSTIGTPSEFNILFSNATISYGNIDESIEFKDDYFYDEANETFKHYFDISDSKWHYFRCSFKTNSGTDNLGCNVGFKCEKPYQLWHVKLEEGTVATAWSPSPLDSEEQIEGSKQAYDAYLAQDEIFDKLFKNSETGLVSDGIVMLDANETLSGRPELYISATYLSSGILRSKNWNGTLSSKFVQRTINGHDCSYYDYDVQTAPTAGMYINLNEGRIWAARFELNAWDYDDINWDTSGTLTERGSGLYLNSHPATTPKDDSQKNLFQDDYYYLKMGNMEQSYMTFDSAGTLKMRVNNFYLTESLGGENLLKQTKPKKTIPQTKKVDGKEVYVKDETTKEIVYDYDLSAWSEWDEKNPSSTSNPVTGSDTVLAGYKDYLVAKGTTTLTQAVEKVISGKEYTLSGYVIGGSGTLTLNITGGEAVEDSNTLNTVNYNGSSWTFFTYTFKTTATSITVKFSGTTNFKLYHAKLEKGGVATEWCESDWDVSQNVLSEKDKLNQYLDQDKVFEKLITDPATGNTMVGIWMIDADTSEGGAKRKELYINATYIATGILRSRNWDGALEIKQLYEKKADGSDNTSKPLKNSRGELIYTYKIKTPPTKGMYMNLDEGKVWAAKFELSAWDNTKDKGLYLNSHPEDDKKTDYLKIGTSKNQIRYYVENSTEKFLVKAHDGSQGIIIRSHPADGEEYFLVGNSDNFIKFHKKNNVNVIDIKSTSFHLSAGSGDSTIVLTSDSSSNPLQIGKNFYVEWDGSIFAQGGKIGGWVIGESSLESANKSITLNGSNGTLTSSGTGKFNVDSTGKLTSTGAELDSLHVTTKLTTGASCTADITGNTTIGGTLTITGNTEIKGTSTLTIGGNTNVKGRLTVDGAQTWASAAPVTIVVDQPWSANNYEVTISKGIITNVKTVTLASKLFDKADLGDVVNNIADTTVGAANIPIYLSSGTFKPCTYELNKTVPSDAKFTDTTYTAGTGISISNGVIKCTVTGASNHTHSFSYDKETITTGDGSKVTVITGINSGWYTGYTSSNS